MEGAEEGCHGKRGNTSSVVCHERKECNNCNKRKNNMTWTKWNRRQGTVTEFNSYWRVCSIATFINRAPGKILRNPW
jgi:hypothetical protein